jgi:hypothetical protein
MITRLWRGWAATEGADAYQRYLLDELFPPSTSKPPRSPPRYGPAVS